MFLRVLKKMLTVLNIWFYYFKHIVCSKRLKDQIWSYYNQLVNLKCIILVSVVQTKNVLGDDSMSQVVGLPNNSYKFITKTAWVRFRFCKLQKGCAQLAVASDNVYQLLTHDRWFSPGTPASSGTKSCHHDLAESGVKHNKSKSINQSTNIDKEKKTISYLDSPRIKQIPATQVLVFCVGLR